MKKFLLPVLLMVWFTPLFAQQAPLVFVSRVAAVAENGSVRISWQDPKEENAFQVLVYRHTSEITKDNLEDAKNIALVEKGDQIFVDYPPDTSGYYYAILIKSESGDVHEVLIAFRNKTTTAVAVSEVQSDQAARAEISGIKAAAEADSIVLSFLSSRLDRELIIYRSTSPIGDNNDLVRAILIDTFQSNALSYVDFPIIGIPYYYAIFDAVALKIGKPQFELEENVLSVPVEIPLTNVSTAAGSYQGTRAQPLPFLQLNDSIQTGESLRSSLPLATIDVVPLNAETRRAVNALLESSAGFSLADPEPTILPADDTDAENIDPYTLSGILASTFLKGKYEDAEIVLRSYLSIKRSDELTSRAHFYIGQCYYFLGRYREAFIEFLFAEDIYYAESQAWIDVIYARLKDL